MKYIEMILSKITYFILAQRQIFGFFPIFHEPAILERLWPMFLFGSLDAILEQILKSFEIWIK